MSSGQYGTFLLRGNNKGKLSLSENSELGMVYTYNPNFSGGRCRRISNSRPDKSKLVRLYAKNKNTNKRTRVWLKWYRACKQTQDPGFQPQYQRNKRKEEKKIQHLIE
jgi:hypothetical protein